MIYLGIYENPFTHTERPIHVAAYESEAYDAPFGVVNKAIRVDDATTRKMALGVLVERSTGWTAQEQAEIRRTPRTGYAALDENAENNYRRPLADALRAARAELKRLEAAR